jgi:hypothetical protein
MTSVGVRRSAVSEYHDEWSVRIQDLKLISSAWNPRVMAKPGRGPLVQVGIIALAAILGIGSRRFAHALPRLVAAYAGDTMWGLAAFAAIGFLRPRASTRTVTLLAMTFSVAIELSQLYHAPWIDLIRETTLGGLVLGYGFLWSDLACYAAGVGLGLVIEMTRCRHSAQEPNGAAEL